jgi:phosphohistidine phosphatase SixA
MNRYIALTSTLLVITCALFSLSPHAQTATKTTGSAQATYTTAPVVVPTPPAAQPQNALAIADEPYALYEALVRDLWRGGYVIYMRHGTVLPGTTDARGAGEWWKNCATTQRLAPNAMAQAQAVGQALRRQNINISDVQTSEFCRAYDTAVFLGLTPPQRNAFLNALTAYESQKRTISQLAASVATLLASAPVMPQNRLFVGHALPPSIVHPALSILQEGHTAVFKPDGRGSFHLVAALSPGQWQWIGKQMVVSLPIAQAAPQVVQPGAAINQPAQPPVIDPAKELKGAPLLVALKRGGYNLYMRHALATVGQDGDLLKTPMWWENCMIQRNMSDAGRDQARKVGAAIRELKLPIGDIKASQFCRVRETAQLMEIGKFEVTEELNHAIGQRAGTDINATRFKLLSTPPAKGKNALFVSHTHGSPRAEERIMGGIQEAEIVVYLPDGKGGAEPIARIPVVEWDNLISLTKK